MQQARLMRSETDRMVAGVCGGLAEYLSLDPVLVRLAFVVLGLASGVGVVLYVLLWIVMPTSSRMQPEIRLMNEPSVDDPSALKPRFSPAATVGIIMILVGVSFLLNQFGLMSSSFWPIVLVGAGLFLLLRRGRQ